MFVLTCTFLTFLQPTRAHVYASVHVCAYTVRYNTEQTGAGKRDLSGPSGHKVELLPYRLTQAARLSL